MAAEAQGKLAYDNGEKAYKSQTAYLVQHRNNTETRLNNTLQKASEQKAASIIDYNNASAVYGVKLSAYNGVLTEPANTAFGDLQNNPNDEGFLRVQGAPNRAQVALLKFNTAKLKGDDTIAFATLKLYKDAGPGGPVLIDIASCQWARNTLTYTKSMNMAYERASQGINSVIPEEQKVWMSIRLRGDAVENSRLAGEHICLMVHGGPEDNPAIFASELAQDASGKSLAPVLDLDVKEKPPKLQYAKKKASIPVVKPVPKDDREMCQDRIKQELTEKYIKEQLDANAVNAEKGVENLQANAAATQNGNNVLNVMQMQTQGTQLAGDMIASQTTAIESAAQAQITNQLSAMAANGATVEAISVASAQLSAQAQQDVAQASSAAAQNIQQQTRQGLQSAETNLQAQNELEAKKLQEKAEELQKMSSQLTATQKAQVNVKVVGELANAIKVCAVQASTSSRAVVELGSS